MSRNLDSALVSEIESPVNKPIILCEFLFDGGPVRLWNGIGDLTVDGNTFTGAGNLLGISEYQETERLEAVGLTFSLSGISTTLISLALQEPYQGREVRLWFSTYLGTSPLEIAPPYLQFSGQMDVMSIQESGDNCTISVAAESKMIIGTRTKERRYTDEDQKSLWPGDGGFRFVAKIQDSEIFWGPQ